MIASTIIQLQFASIEWTDFGCVTRFSDGAEVSAWPHPEMHHYHVISHRLGYGDDVLAYAREHEFAHEFLSEWLTEKPSIVLWALAHAQHPPSGPALLEEMAVQSFQRWLRANERPILDGCDWDGMKRDALELLAGAR